MGLIPKSLPVLSTDSILHKMAVDRITAFDQAIMVNDTSELVVDKDLMAVYGLDWHSKEY